MVRRRSWLRAHLRRHFRRALFRSWLRLCCAARRLTCWSRCRPCLSFLIALAALALAAVFTILALSIFGLAILALATLGVGTAAALARRQIGGRRPVIGADQNLGAVGQIGKARDHDAVGGRKPTCDHSVVFVLLRHHDRLGGRDIAGA